MKRRTHSRTKKGHKHLRVHFIFIYSTMGVLGLTVLFAAAQFVLAPLAAKNVSEYSNTNVLGEENSIEDADLNRQMDQLAEDQKKMGREMEALQKPTLAPDRIEVKTHMEDGQKEMEIETHTGQKVKTNIEKNGVTKIEIEHKKLKLKYHMEHGNIVKMVQDEQGNDVHLNENEFKGLEDEVETNLAEEGIKIQKNGTGRISFGKHEITATTDFPLSIDTGTNQFVVTTPAGEKIVAVLPDAAVENMLKKGVINELNSDKEGSESGDVEFTVKNDEPVYKIEGLKKFKFLGFIPVSQPVTAVVSSETGNEVDVEQPFFTKFVDFLSP